MRPPPNGSPPPIVPRQTDTITQVREYRLITPLFGGGVTPGEADPVTVVRASEIRGHLRFWWRACRGGQFDSLSAMKAREDAIWGTAARKGSKNGPSPIQVVITHAQAGRPFPATDHRGQPVNNIGHPRSRDSYAAFPLRDVRGGAVQQDITFTLALTFPADLGDDLAAALWAWETFGGIGARTRRGFGALHCTAISESGQSRSPDLPRDAQHAPHWIAHQIAHHTQNRTTWPPHVPHLHPNPRMRITSASDDAITVWRHLIQRLRDFRQHRTGRFGRSRWPEPTAIRQLTGRSHPNHRHPPIPDPPVRKFPRAAFGLPIMFEFKRNDQAAGDPEGKNTLQARDGNTTYDRLASPLILRPIPCTDQTFVGVALVLHTPARPPGALIIETTTGTHTVSSNLTPAEAGRITAWNSNETDILQAFLDTL